MVEDILLDIVGGEKGLVKKILGYKLDLETETLNVNLNRFSWLDRFSKIKQMIVTNTFENTIKVSFSPRGYNKKPFECNIELNEAVSFNQLTKKQKQILSTFDLAFVKLMRGNQSNEKMELLIKKQIRSWNLAHFNKDCDKLYFKEYETINFNENQSPVPILRLNQ